MTTRQYVGTGITVHWDSDRCFHSERCTTGLPSVFNRSVRPWVNLVDAQADDVAAVIDTCPSGALSYTRTDGVVNGRRGRTEIEDPEPSLAVDIDWTPASVTVTPELVETIVTITPLLNGPLSVRGPVGLTSADGTVVVVDHCELCRCGQSSNKPYCDGSHARVGFVEAGFAQPTTGGDRS